MTIITAEDIGQARPPTLPVAHFSETHSRLIHATPGACLDAVQRFRIEDDWLSRCLLAIRDLPGRLIRGTHAHRFGMASFLPLGREGDRTVRYGLAGRFWRPDYGLDPLTITPSDFWSFDGTSCRLLLSFETWPVAVGKTRLITRTTIYCPCPDERWKMALYWRLIRPVSGLIRHRLLGCIARDA